MNDAAQVLVIILSVTLTIFLIVNIVFFVLAIKLVRSVKRISAKAEALTDKAEAVSEFVQHAAVPMLVGKIMAGFSDIVSSRKPKSKRKSEE